LKGATPVLLRIKAKTFFSTHNQKTREKCDLDFTLAIFRVNLTNNHHIFNKNYLQTKKGRWQRPFRL